MSSGQTLGLFGFGFCNHTFARGGGVDHSCTADKYHAFSVVDEVLIPTGIEPGDYLLSWRWDCEQTTQIWQVRAESREEEAGSVPALILAALLRE